FHADLPNAFATMGGVTLRGLLPSTVEANNAVDVSSCHVDEEHEFHVLEFEISEGLNVAATRDSTATVDASRLLDVTTALLATVVRLGFAERVGNAGMVPEKLLQLYEFEACPYCRKVREALTVLDLEVMIYPCPKGSSRFRDVVRARGGREQFPYFVDPN